MLAQKTPRTSTEKKVKSTVKASVTTDKKGLLSEKQATSKSTVKKPVVKKSASVKENEPILTESPKASSTKVNREPLTSAEKKVKVIDAKLSKKVAVKEKSQTNIASSVKKTRKVAQTSVVAHAKAQAKTLVKKVANSAEQLIHHLPEEAQVAEQVVRSVEDVKALVLAGVGATVLTAERIAQMKEHYTREGILTRKEAEALGRELQARATQQAQELQRTITDSVSQAVAQAITSSFKALGVFGNSQVMKSIQKEAQTAQKGVQKRQATQGTTRKAVSTTSDAPQVAKVARSTRSTERTPSATKELVTSNASAQGNGSQKRRP
ncbi:MAG: hypothetical protein ACKO37_01130 [Vampirovibrionales bacterium]